MLLAIVVALLAYKIFPIIWRALRQRKALKIAREQISSKTKHLIIRRLQLVRPDFYGTVVLDKWEKEKDYLIETIIRPRLMENSIDDCLKTVRPIILFEIEKSANASVGPSDGLTVTPQGYISDPRVFDNRMDPVHYEQYCELELERAGWTTRATPVTGDQGADILAERAGITLVAQCKLYSGSVGNGAVQEVNTARDFYKADRAVVVSNASYTPSAYQAAGNSDVSLLHHSELRAYTGLKSTPASQGGGSHKLFPRGG